MNSWWNLGTMSHRILHGQNTHKQITMYASSSCVVSQSRLQCWSYSLLDTCIVLCTTTSKSMQESHNMSYKVLKNGQAVRGSDQIFSQIMLVWNSLRLKTICTVRSELAWDSLYIPRQQTILLCSISRLWPCNGDIYTLHSLIIIWVQQLEDVRYWDPPSHQTQEVLQVLWWDLFLFFM